jgi:hypothetical protein
MTVKKVERYTDQTWPSATDFPFGDNGGTFLHTETMHCVAMSSDDLPDAVILAMRPIGCEIGVYMAFSPDQAREYAAVLMANAASCEQQTIQ